MTIATYLLSIFRVFMQSVSSSHIPEEKKLDFLNCLIIILYKITTLDRYTSVFLKDKIVKVKNLFAVVKELNRLKTIWELRDPN